MSYTKTEIAQLILNKISGSATDREEDILREWRQRSQDNEAFYQAMLKPGSLRSGIEEFEEARQRAAQVKAPNVSTPVRHVHFLRKWGWVAASVLIVLGIGAYFLSTGKKNATSIAITEKAANIGPGKDGAILTLADGSQVILDSLGNGLIADQKGVQVLLQNGQLAYDPTGVTTGEMMYNTLVTPRGRQFQVVLPDGTRVWLNAASSIRYPTVFTGKERRVEITGEAYFEVTKNTRMPFFVKADNKAEVEVLGTSFNMNAYEDESTINTTLLEGSVRVNSFQSLSSDRPVAKVQRGLDNYLPAVILKPGQQAQILNISDRSATSTAKKKEIKVINNADIDKVMAWKNGLFNFEGASLQEVMKQLERWYDIEVVYEKGVPNTTFFGEISKLNNLQELLAILEKSEVHFRIEEKRRLVVLP